MTTQAGHRSASGGPGRALVRVLRLLVPVLVPSWRFFDAIGPSPRIEYRWEREAADGRARSPWHRLAFAPPARRPLAALAALLHDPRRNESLYLLSCCVRVLEAESDAREHGSAGPHDAGHARAEILRRVREVARRDAPDTEADRLHVRLLQVWREGTRLREAVAIEFVVPAHAP